MIRDVSSLARLDSFPYRHRLAEVMAQPVLTCGGEITLVDACDRMDQAKVSSLVVVDGDGRAVGIVTERDVMRVIARNRAAALQFRLSDIMSSPVRTVPGDAFVYVGIARMTRLGLRHLVVVDHAGRPMGMVTGRALLKVRANQALVIGDDIEQAATTADLDRARQALPALASDLLSEGVSARNVAAVISTVLRDITSRAAHLTEASMLADGWGAAPATWSLLVLGSAGRGESLLSFDQDNAIVHLGGATEDAWFAELGRRLNAMLNDVGIPFCDGEVMARDPAWRRSLEDWKEEIRRWVFQPELKTMMYVDIFFDFVCVYGDHDLAAELKRFAIEVAATSALFVQFLAFNVQKMDVPLGMWGGFTTSQGRFNAKKLGLLPLVSAARAKAVRNRIDAVGTAERYGALQAAGTIHPEDLTGLLEAHETILGIMLDQQLTDIADGRKPSANVEPRKFPVYRQRLLKSAFHRIRTLKALMA